MPIMSITRTARRHRTRTLAYAMAMGMLCQLPWWSSASAQTTGTAASPPPAGQTALLADTSLARRTLEARAASLPGAAVALDTLVRRALREAVDVRRAEALLALRRGAEREARAVFDPTARLSSIASAAEALAPQRQQLLEGGIGWTAPTGMQVDAFASRASLRSLGGTAEPAWSGSSPSTWGVGLSQPLLEGFRQPNVEPRATAAERIASAAALRRTRQIMATSVELAYWSLAEAQVVEAVFERSVEISRELLARYEELARRDLVPNLDLLTMRSGAAQRDALRIGAQQARRERSDDLLLLVYGERAAVRLGADTIPLKTGETDAAPPPARPLDELLPVAAVRADVQEAAARRDGAELRVGRARNALLPSLALTGTYATAMNTPGLPISASGARQQNTWQLGLGVGLPLFNRRDRGAVEQATAALDLATLDTRARESEAVAEIRTAWRAVAMGRERLRSSEQAAAFAWAQLGAERRRVELGLGDAFRLLQTEEAAVRSQLDATSARFALLRADARLRLALGQTASDN